MFLLQQLPYTPGLDQDHDQDLGTLGSWIVKPHNQLSGLTG
jgi:hypothetical protein